MPPPPGVTRAHNSCPKAIVVFDHVPPAAATGAGQVALERSQIVDVIDQSGPEWWKVADAVGRTGYYPAHYLKII